MQKADLINLVIVRSPGTPEQLTKLRQQLSWKNIAELEQIVDEQNAQIRAEAVPAPSPRVAGGGLHRIFQIPINGKVAVRNEAAERIIEGWVDEIRGDVLSPEWFIQVLKETPQLANQLQWQSADVLDPKKRRAAEAAQAEKARDTFSSFVKANGYADNDANFHLTQDVVFGGNGFSKYELEEAVQSGRLRLAPASPEQLAEWAQEAAEERQEFLANRASPEEAHAIRVEETEQSRVRFQRQEAARSLAARAEADKAFGYPPLPQIHVPTGETIDSAWLNRISNTNLPLFKALLIKHGNFALTQRLKGLEA
jgi:hypothetical protein